MVNTIPYSLLFTNLLFLHLMLDSRILVIRVPGHISLMFWLKEFYKFVGEMYILIQHIFPILYWGSILDGTHVCGSLFKIS